jgi:hypothetical protein
VLGLVLGALVVMLLLLIVIAHCVADTVNLRSVCSGVSPREGSADIQHAHWRGGGGRRYAELVFGSARELLYAGVGVVDLMCGGR